MVKKKIIIKKWPYFLLSLLAIFLAAPAHAICPVCTVAVVAGVGLARYLGVDDTVTGLWIGGLIVSMTMWTIIWLKSKNIKFYGLKTLTTIFYYLIVIVPLYWKNIIGHPYNKLWGVDKLLLGIAIGSCLFLAGAAAHFELKKKNGEKVYFPFQKVVFAILPLIFFSAVFYFITR